MLLRYGVDESGHVVAAVGDEVIDLAEAAGLDVPREVFACGSLNAFMSLGPGAWESTRRRLREGVRAPAVQPRLVLPWRVGDYADFYASREHATNMGRLLRPGEDPLPAAWVHIPLGYHGRSGSVVVSGEPVYRPAGVLPGGGYGPTEKLDVEMELGFVVGRRLARGATLSAAEAEGWIFGVVLVNDWSARDIQAFEYRPLGPFLGKSFATSVSAWVVPWAELSPWRVPGPAQDPEPAAYLKAAEPRGLDVRLRLSVNGTALSETSSAGLYWSPAQQLAHLSASGSGLRVGDLFASGTVSGEEPGTQGSLMEIYAGERFLADGDVVSIEGWCGPHRLGEVTAEVTTR
ncbi:MAG TPA: fumarylacetoacetate hydrolase family protein [Acidimicrobiales bacterium]|nr:fumarylacetoacetate hydrolase family protein [Acidimicrobiales bacterium]